MVYSLIRETHINITFCNAKYVYCYLPISRNVGGREGRKGVNEIFDRVNCFHVENHKSKSTAGVKLNLRLLNSVISAVES